jgi:hypothetical protein
VEGDQCQTQNQLGETLNVTQATNSKSLKVMGKVHKEGDASHEPKRRYWKVKDHIRKSACQAKDKGFFYIKMLLSLKNRIYFDNPKRRKTICEPRQQSTFTPKPSFHGKNVMPCIWTETWPNSHRISTDSKCSV